MNGFITKTATTLGLAGGLVLCGCDTYRNLVDPCYPQRYEYASRQEALGHIVEVSNAQMNWQPSRPLTIIVETSSDAAVTTFVNAVEQSVGDALQAALSPFGALHPHP